MRNAIATSLISVIWKPKGIVCINPNQKHRANVSSENTETFYRRSVFVPLLDGVISQMKVRFSKHNEKALQLRQILPQSTHEKGSRDRLNECYAFYKPIPPQNFLESFRGEFDIWCGLWAERETLPDDAISALGLCDRDCFPIIHTLLKILAIQPVSTASAERSFSCLRRLKTWMRTCSDGNEQG